MDRNELLALHRLSNLTPKQLAVENPALHAQLVAKVDELSKNEAGKRALPPVLADTPLAENPVLFPELERSKDGAIPYVARCNYSN